jgi:hypothetical protein
MSNPWPIEVPQGIPTSLTGRQWQWALEKCHVANIAAQHRVNIDEYEVSVSLPSMHVYTKEPQNVVLRAIHRIQHLTGPSELLRITSEKPPARIILRPVPFDCNKALQLRRRRSLSINCAIKPSSRLLSTPPAGPYYRDPSRYFPPTVISAPAEHLAVCGESFSDPHLTVTSRASTGDASGVSMIPRPVLYRKRNPAGKAVSGFLDSI